MTNASSILELRSSPHLRGGTGVDTIMFNVVVALVPVCLFSIYHFGLAALLTLTTALVSCVVTEQAYCKLNRSKSTLGDWSVTITGLLYGLTLPPGLSLWMVMVGGVVAVAVGKLLFGGLGYNPFNPALIGRAFLQAAFPVAMTSWPVMPSHRFMAVPSSTLAFPLTTPDYDGVSGATPLTAWKFEGVSTGMEDLFLGSVAGSTGETSALIILLGGTYLALRRMLNWRIPAAILATVFTISSVLHLASPDRFAGPLFMLFSGGLMLGAVFMATDMVASPLTNFGSVLYGVLIGALVVVIRTWGGMPEGVMYSILLANAISPHIDSVVRNRVFGTQRRWLVREVER